jgi:hypothetical protein
MTSRVRMLWAFRAEMSAGKAGSERESSGRERRLEVGRWGLEVGDAMEGVLGAADAGYDGCVGAEEEGLGEGEADALFVCGSVLSEREWNRTPFICKKG